MIGDARRWRILAGGVAAGMAGVLGLAGTIASAEPVYPYLPQPAPAPIAQAMPAVPGAAAAAQAIGPAPVGGGSRHRPRRGTSGTGDAGARQLGVAARLLR